MSLSERVAWALGWTVYVRTDQSIGYDPPDRSVSNEGLPDPGSIEVVWQLRTLAIKKDGKMFVRALCALAGINECANATLEQIREAALQTLEAKGGG
jgi:hypothetical protein